MSKPNRWWILLVVCAVFVTFTSAHAGENWKRWKNSLKPKGAKWYTMPVLLNKPGTTMYRIVIPVAPTTQEQKAAEDLAVTLKDITNVDFPVVSDDTMAGEKEISVGNTNRLELEGLVIDKAALGDDGYSIQWKKKSLFLVGGKKRGIINAVYAFLEEDLGCRWYLKEVATLPVRKRLTVRPVSRQYTPPFALRDPYYSTAFDKNWSLRNMTNSPNAPVKSEWGGHWKYALFVHTFNTLLPPDAYFVDHPEYFMMDEAGQRVPRQLCTTNEDVIRIVTENTLAALAENPSANIICVSKNDGGGTCTCPSCKAIDDAEGSNMGALLHLVNRVAEAVEAVRPNAYVTTLAYLETVKPPKTMRPRKNVIIRLCTDNCMWAHPFTPAREVPAFSSALEGWANVHDKLSIWDYCVNFSHYPAPMPNMDAIADNLRYFARNNVIGVMEQGAYQCPGGENDQMRAWIMAKLMWDPSRDVWQLTQDFIWGMFGKSSKYIAEYNRLLREQGARYAVSMNNIEGGIRYDMNAAFLTREFLDKATELYNLAEHFAENEVILNQVERDSLPILYARINRGPGFCGKEYPALVKKFERIARKVGMTNIAEGAPDLDAKISVWTNANDALMK